MIRGRSKQDKRNIEEDHQEGGAANFYPDGAGVCWGIAGEGRFLRTMRGPGSAEFRCGEGADNASYVLDDPVAVVGVKGVAAAFCAEEELSHGCSISVDASGRA